MNSGRLVIGPLNGSVLSSFVYPATSSTGAVSPMPLAIASTTAVTRPERAVGSTTFHTVRHWLAPSAYDASRRVFGTSRITTSAARVTIGIIITVSASEAANPVRPTPSASTTDARMNNPATIDGSAVI